MLFRSFLYPGFMYLASIFKLVGFGYITSIKAVLVFSVIVASSAMYLWLRKLFNNMAALVGTAAFIFSPYYLFDIYQRGSVGEIFAFTWVTLSLYTIVSQRLLFTGIMYALLVLSHNTLALLMLPLLCVYQWVEVRSWKKIGRASCRERV